MGFCASILNKATKGIGTIIQKISEFIGIAIGVFREQILKHKDEKEKWHSKGKVKGKVLKRDIDNFGETSSYKINKLTQIIGRFTRKATLYILITLNSLAKLIYKGTEKLKISFEKYNDLREVKLQGESLNTKERINGIEHTFLGEESEVDIYNLQEKLYDNREYIDKLNEYEDIEIDLGETQIMNTEYINEGKKN